MSTDTASTGLQYLSVAKAAETLGIPRLRVREAAALGAFPSLRDNNGRLRIDLSGQPPGYSPPEQAQGIAPATLLDILFDEVEDLKAANDEATREVGALKDLAARQAGALERAEALLDSEAESKARLISLLDRAMEQLAARDGGIPGLADATEDTTARLERSLEQNARFDALLERAVDYAAMARSASDENALAMAGTADRAMGMLDRAMAEAEGGRKVAVQTEAMLDRALAAGERMQRQIAERDETIEDRTATADRALELSERAMALAGPGGSGPKKGFWRRLFRL